jgi:mono/diheme cytochrome c family protein
MKLLTAFALLLAGAALGALVFIYSGVYYIGADDAHTKPVYWALETLRTRSVARSAAAVEVPPLDDAALLLSGGPDYADMCAGCHLQPGVKESDMSMGLYPQPPNLAEAAHSSPAEMFWVIKHGIKMTAMPAWGPGHDDQRIWAMVAFLQRLPELTPAQYQILTAREAGENAQR